MRSLFIVLKRNQSFQFSNHMSLCNRSLFSWLFTFIFQESSNGSKIGEKND